MSVEMLPKEQHPAHSVPMLAPEPVKRSLIDYLPVRLVVLLASPYLAGKDYVGALAKGHEVFGENHFCGTLDILGEDSASTFDCDQYVEKYFQLIDAVAADPIHSSFDREKLTISMKPSMFSY